MLKLNFYIIVYRNGTKSVMTKVHVVMVWI